MRGRGDWQAAWNGRTYENRGGMGVRVYLEARVPDVVVADAVRADRRALPGGRELEG